MARALAICEGGPLDGVVVSVVLGEDGSPQPLESRQAVLGVLYRPAEEVGVSPEHEEPFEERVLGADGEPVVRFKIEHDRAFVYRMGDE